MHVRYLTLELLSQIIECEQHTDGSDLDTASKNCFCFCCWPQFVDVKTHPHLRASFRVPLQRDTKLLNPKCSQSQKVRICSDSVKMKDAGLKLVRFIAEGHWTIRCSRSFSTTSSGKLQTGIQGATRLIKTEWSCNFILLGIVQHATKSPLSYNKTLPGHYESNASAANSQASLAF